MLLSEYEIIPIKNLIQIPIQQFEGYLKLIKFTELKNKMKRKSSKSDVLPNIKHLYIKFKLKIFKSF